MRTVYEMNSTTVLKIYRSSLEYNSRQSHHHFEFRAILRRVTFKVDSFRARHMWGGLKTFHCYTPFEIKSRKIITRHPIGTVKWLFIGSCPIQVYKSARGYEGECLRYWLTRFIDRAAVFCISSWKRDIDISGCLALGTWKFNNCLVSMARRH